MQPIDFANMIHMTKSTFLSSLKISVHSFKLHHNLLYIYAPITSDKGHA